MKVDRRLFFELGPVRLLFFLAVGLGLINGLLVIGLAYTLTQIINNVFLKDATLTDVQGLFAWLIGLAGLRLIVQWGSELAALHVTEHIKTSLRERLFSHLLQLGPVALTQEHSGELVNTLLEGVESLDGYFRQLIPQLFLMLLVPLAIFWVVVPQDVLSALILICTAPLLPLFMMLIGRWAGAVGQRQFKSLSYLSAHFLDVLQGLTTLKLFNRSQAQIKTIGRLSDDFRVATMQVLRVAFLSALALELLTTLSIAMIAVEIGLRLLYGKMAFEQAFFILVITPEFYQPLRNFGASFHAASAGNAAAQRIFELLETSPALATITEAIPLPNPPFHIEFRAVSYQYLGRERPALHNLQLELRPGQHIAIVGPSGAGKSTMINLLLRFLEPTTGQILVNGIPLATIMPEAWRSQLAWVSQKPYLFNTTLLENIRLAKPTASLDEIVWAGEQAGLTELVAQLPNGWQTPIGERGARLSGGQAQRVALARAFLKDAPLLIWDEATTHLDSNLETQIQTAMQRLMQGRAVVMIAHRLHTIRQADQILVLSEGQVIEMGTHDFLLNQHRLYHQLVMTYD
ncbi:MAG: thiol reductant ABC exporter subunit CydD [Chloroflexi bacterium]|nr:thiol reductant ABC exporter subunit CydD [Chloroflexota bacterium]